MLAHVVAGRNVGQARGGVGVAGGGERGAQRIGRRQGGGNGAQAPGARQVEAVRGGRARDHDNVLRRSDLLAQPILLVVIGRAVPVSLELGFLVLQLLSASHKRRVASFSEVSAAVELSRAVLP